MSEYYGNSGDIYDAHGSPIDPDDPDPMAVFSIVHLPDGRLGVEMAAANEMSFDLEMAGADYMEAITDICQVAPRILRYDGDLTEAHDNGFRTRPRMDDQQAISAFVVKYRARLKNVQVDFFNV